MTVVDHSPISGTSSHSRQSYYTGRISPEQPTIPELTPGPTYSLVHNSNATSSTDSPNGLAKYFAQFDPNANA